MKQENFRAMSAKEATLAILKEYGPMTVRDISEEIGKHYRSASRAAEDLHAQGLLVIRGWHQFVRHVVPMYDIKRSKTWKDARKPAPMTNVEAARRYRVRHKARIDAKRLAKHNIQVNPFGQLVGFLAAPHKRARDVEADVVRMFETEKVVSRIARDLGCSVNIVTRILVKHGLRQTRKRARRIEEEPKVIALLEEGHSCAEILRRVPIGRDLCYKIAHEWRGTA